jgi:hypothetical protein
MGGLFHSQIHVDATIIAIKIIFSNQIVCVCVCVCEWVSVRVCGCKSACVCVRVLSNHRVLIVAQIYLSQYLQ